VLSSIDDRVENDEILTRIQQSGNPYAAMREYYLKRRLAEIDVLRGKRCNADINLADLEFMDSLPETKKPSKKSPASPKN
jgi:ABC-type transporter lipoprotein component MlaA